MLATDESVSEAILDVRAALGKEPADIVLRGCRLVNVCSEEVHDATIAIRGSRIVAIREEYAGPAHHEIDCRRLYALPGAIEPYFETSPGVTAEALLARGVTAVVHAAGTDVAVLATGGLRCFDLGGAALPLQPHQFCTSAEEALFHSRHGTTVVLDCGNVAAWRELFEQLRAQNIDSSRFLVKGAGRETGSDDGLLSASLAAGMPAANAAQLMTFNPAIHFALDHEVGSITPGRRADIVLVSEPGGRPRQIILDGQPVDLSISL